MFFPWKKELFLESENILVSGTLVDQPVGIHVIPR